MAATLEPIPETAEVIEEDKTLSQDYWRWIDQLKRRLEACARVVKALRLTGQTAAIATATLYTTLEAGTYRVTWSMRPTVAATTSGSLALTLGWADLGTALSPVGPTLSGAPLPVTSQQSGQVVFDCDTATNITYAVAYASVGATAMTYKLTLTVELVS